MAKKKKEAVVAKAAKEIKKEVVEEVKLVEEPVDVEATVVVEVTPEVVVKEPVVSKIDLDFNREELNQLRDKVNEIIDFLSK